MFSGFTYSTAVSLLVMLLRPSVTQDLSDSSVTVELLDNRRMYCLGETARIRCNITGSDNDSSIVFDWVIGSTGYNPATIPLPGHTVSPSDHFVLQVFQTEAYSANYSCSRRTGSITTKSRAKLLTFASTTFPAPTVICTNTTSNSVTVVVRDTNRCGAAEVTVAIIGRSNCFTTGHEVYLCAGLQAQTTYTISAVATTRMSNGSVLATAMGIAVCTTGAIKETILSIKGNDVGAVGALAALFTVSFFIIIFLLCTLLICTVTIRKLKSKLHSQEVTDPPHNEALHSEQDGSEAKTEEIIEEIIEPQQLQRNPAYCSIEMMTKTPMTYENVFS